MRLATLAILLGPITLAAQGTPVSKEPAVQLTEAQQIAAAVLPLPAEFRDSARVLGYRAGSTQLTALRDTRGAFTCLAPDPSTPRFHVACYHRSLEPFMARGRALRANGITGDRVDTLRFAEIKEGKLEMPVTPAALYSLTGPPGSYDPATNKTNGARPLFVIYVAGATAMSTGLSARPAEGTPWIMFPGTPKAHIMFVPRM